MAPPRAHAAAFASFASSIRSLTIAAAVAVLRSGGADAWAQTADSTAVLTVHLRSTEGAVSFAQVRAGRVATLTNPEGVAVLRLRAGPRRRRDPHPGPARPVHRSSPTGCRSPGR